MNLKEYQKTIPHILELFKSNTAGDLEFRTNKAKEDFWFFFRSYLPHYASVRTPKFHKEIVDLLESHHSPVVIGAPRGFSKSTLVSFAYIIWNIIREKFYFIVIVSATDTLANDLCDFIRLEFSSNKRITNDFGELLVKKGSENDFIANKTRILGRGRKQALRGFRSQEHRPDLIILDDIEKDEEALNPKTVKKTLDTITRGLIPSLTPKGKLIIVGTILRRRSVMGTLLLDNEEPWNSWTKKLYRAIELTDDGKEISLWSERFPLKFLRRQKTIMGISSFNAEYQNMPTDEESAMFKEEHIKSGTVDPDSSKVIFIDPSIDGIKKRDFKAAILVAKSNNKFEVVDAVLVQGSDTVFFEQVIAMYQKHQHTILGTYIESNSFQQYYMKDLDNYTQEQGVDLRLSGSKHYQKKELRISRILPLFETDRIVFNPQLLNNKMGKILVEQLLYFPNSAVHDDGADALAGAIEALNNISPQSASNSYQVLPKPKKKWDFY